MDIVMKKTGAIKPYTRNPRINDEAVEFVKASIREFGFKVPIVIDQQGIIVTGHTRHKAAKQLKLKEIPCIVADDLTPEQIKAFRLADNKVSEIAKWDESILQEELADLLELNFTMEPFGFEFDLELPEDEPELDEEDKENARMNTMHQYNLEFYDQEKNRDFTAGICFDIYSEGDIPRTFFLYDGPLDPERFLRDRTPMDIRALKAHLKQSYPGHHKVTKDIALIDAVVSTDPIVGAKAIWKSETISGVMVTRCHPASTGFSSLVGVQEIIERKHPYGGLVRLGQKEGYQDILAPIAPGVLERVRASPVIRIEEGKIHRFEAVERGTVALDGEREIVLRKGDQYDFKITRNGPLQVDSIRIVTQAQKEGKFILSGEKEILWRNI